MSSHTRRQALAVAVGAASAIPCIAVGELTTAQAASPDPAYAAIERHRAAWAANLLAIRHYNEVDGAMPDRPIVRIKVGERDGWEYDIRENRDATIITKRRTGKREDVFAADEIEIENHAKSLPESERAAWIAQKTRELTAAQDNYWETPDGRLIRAAEDEGMQSEQAAEEAALALLDTRPTTIAGAAAILRYVFEHEAANQCGWMVDLEGNDLPKHFGGWSFESEPDSIQTATPSANA